MAIPILGDGALPCDIMVVGERAGIEEWRAGRPFVGPAGEELWHRLWLHAKLDRDGTESGISLYVTNLVKTFATAPPSPTEIARDQGVLRVELQRARPRLIVAVGAYAARWFLPQFVGVPQEVWHGLAYRYSYGRLVKRTCTIVPVVHSAAALRQPERYQNLFAADCRAVRVAWDALEAGHDPTHRTRRPSIFRVGLAGFGKEGLTLGVDTEGTPDTPECVALASDLGHACVIEADAATGYTSKFLAPALKQASRIYIHAALGDHQILTRLGIPLDADRLDDTMILAALLGLPQGLKTLAYRELSYEMSSYEDLVTPIDNTTVRETLDHAYQTEMAAKTARADAEKASRHAHTLAARAARTTRGGVERRVRADQSHGRLDGRGRSSLPVRAAAMESPPPFPTRALTSLKKILTTETEDTLRARWGRSAFAAHVPLPPPATWRSAPLEDRIPYVMADAVAHLAVGKRLRSMVIRDGLTRVYRIDRGVLPLLSRSESIGMAVDRRMVRRLTEEFTAAFAEIGQRIDQLAGYHVNPISGEQVSDCLFENLGIDPTRPTKSRKHYTTADKYLKARKLQHRIIPLILEARQLNKYLGTYTVKLPDMLKRDAARTWRYHPDWRYTRTATGRLAETIILLIPKHSPRAKQIRNCFHATEGHSLVSVDLSQIELRVMADVSGDAHLLKAYQQGEDLHAQVAHELLGAPKGKANQDESLHRLPAKTMNFGIINGMTEYGILDQLHEAGQLQWDFEMVVAMRKGWFRLHQGVYRFWQDQIAHGQRWGYIRNKFGRRRYLAGLRSQDERVRVKTEREALFSIQSTADDISKVWNARIWQTIIQPRLREGGATGRRYCEWWCRIHDATVLEVDSRIARTIRQEMLACVPQLLSIPTTADGSIGPRWGGLKG